MEFIFQISGHPKAGKKMMPGLLTLCSIMTAQHFRKDSQISFTHSVKSLNLLADAGVIGIVELPATIKKV
jgi:hypothetical protein